VRQNSGRAEMIRSRR